MKRVPRIFKIIVAVIFIIPVILFSASLIMQDEVAGIILRSLNTRLSTKFTYGSVKLSFIRKFPNASLDLKNVVVFSSPGFDRLSFGGINTDTLLSTKSALIEFRITDVARGVYNMERIGIKGGILNILTDTSGSVNYEIASKNPDQTKEVFTIDLKRINVTDLKAVYNNLATKLYIQGTAREGRLKSRISGENIDFTAEAGVEIDMFKLYNFNMLNKLNAAIDINLEKSSSGVTFSKGSFKIDKNDFGLSGSVSKDNIVNLFLEGDNINITEIGKYFPEKFQEKIAGYKPSGILTIKSRFSGPVSRKVNPQIKMDFTLQEGSVTYKNSSLTINDLSFSGNFSNGSARVPATSLFSIRDFNGRLGTAQYSGAFSISNFNSLNTLLQLKGRFIPSEMKDFLNMESASTTEGSIDFDLKMEGSLTGRENFSWRDLLKFDTQAGMKFNSFGIGLRHDTIKVTQVSGNLFVSDTVSADGLQLIYKDMKIGIDGNFLNLPGWLAGEPVILNGSADIHCDRVAPEAFNASFEPKGSSGTKRKAIKFPGNIILDLNFNIDKFIYKSFGAENISGLVSYKPYNLNFKSLSLVSMDGEISGTGFISQNNNKSHIARGDFKLNNIDVNKAFSIFHNFGQDFIKAENLAGKLSGSLSLLMPMDSLLKPDTKAIISEGKYTLLNGALINFDPVKKLSAYIELSELENIYFDRLENNIFIRNSSVHVPQMDVRSSAADLLINGKHGFDNKYEYHLSILLSELLSKKIKNNRSNSSEWAIKDDGLGRTSVFLKIDEKSVSYDFKAAGSQIKSNIKKEQQTLKSILNEEYGWFKGDSTTKPKTKTGSSRFKITWEERDSVQTEQPPAENNNANPVKNLFRRR